jgi:hypothetical protein
MDDHIERTRRIPRGQAVLLMGATSAWLWIELLRILQASGWN